MSQNQYVCLDLGASGGKMSLGQIIDKKLVFQEIHRFKNGMIEKGTKNCWDLDLIFNEAIIGLKKIKKMGISKCFLGIDTWAVDYALIDQDGNLLDDIYAYRDKRTNNFFKRYKDEFDPQGIYMQTGIVPLEFNTMYQLYAQQIWNYKNLDKILMLPDYLVYLLTKKKVAEVTNLATTQLFDVTNLTFKEKMLEKLRISQDKFGQLIHPGEIIGPILPDLKEKYDLPDVTVIAVASHDTSSAIAAIPSNSDEEIYISSGTWSLLGTELSQPIINRTTFVNQFTNQLGVDNKITFLKNIIGMWIVQEIEKNLSNKFSIVELIHEAQKYESFEYIMDCEDKRYIKPDNMMFSIWKYFEESGQRIPFTIGQLIRCVFDSLALCYLDNVHLLEEIVGKELKNIYIFGGGCQNKLVNQTLANISKKTVYAGPVDASMIGNIVVLMIANHELEDLVAARKMIKASFRVEVFTPDDEDYRSVIRKYNLIKEMRKK